MVSAFLLLRTTHTAAAGALCNRVYAHDCCSVKPNARTPSCRTLTHDGACRLREQVCAANRELVAAGLVTLSFGNASGVDRAGRRDGHQAQRRGLRPAHPGRHGGRLARRRTRRRRHRCGRPPTRQRTWCSTASSRRSAASCTRTRAFASAWAQAGRSIPCLGTTHADHFRGPVPVTRAVDGRRDRGGLRSGDRRRHRRDARRAAASIRSRCRPP